MHNQGDKMTTGTGQDIEIEDNIADNKKIKISNIATNFIIINKSMESKTTKGMNSEFDKEEVTITIKLRRLLS